jgi:hypothetical protein
MRVYATQRQLGKDAQLAAAEIVRRAERGLARAVRKRQEHRQAETRQDGGWRTRTFDGSDGIITGRIFSVLYLVVRGMVGAEQPSPLRYPQAGSHQVEAPCSLIYEIKACDSA